MIGISKGLCPSLPKTEAMEEAAAVRRAASEATLDVVPQSLRDTIEEYIADESAVPGVLTLLSAHTVAPDDRGAFDEKSAGVQLIYDGLRLTRELAHHNPWLDDTASLPPGNTPTYSEPDKAVLAADVLVARGFYVLARTGIADEAVAVVRDFGRDQTDREIATAEQATELDSNLEEDILKLAVLTGVNAAGGHVPDATRIARELAPDTPRFGSADSFFADGCRDRLASLTIQRPQPVNRND